MRVIRRDRRLLPRSRMPGRASEVSAAHIVASADDDVTVVQITAPHYCAGVDLEGGRVTQAADILGWMVRQAVTLDFIRSYVRAKRYSLTIHHPDGSWEYDP